jgi:ABC-type uncharacterized transport system permease subunit/ABC-type multidrug transport system ATPase subunit
VLPSLELRGISKRFGETQALSEVSLSILPGEIHALLGENGAGKSTLVSIAAGRLAADAGEILRNGSPVSFDRARDAGLALVPQHDLLIGAASVADNLAFLDPNAPFFESPAARRARVIRLAQRFALDLGDANARVDALPVGTRQRIEIAGALTGHPEVLILDEPTAVLSPDETAALFASLRKRADAGGAVVLITHRLAEVFAGADRLTLLARGRSVKTCRVSETTPEEIGGLLLAGAVAAAAVGPLLSGAPFVVRAGLLVASALAGALWVLPAAYLEARRGVPEVLSTILLNLIAAAAVSGLVRGALQDSRGDYPQSRALPDAVRLAPLVSGSRATAAIVAAIALALLVTLVVEATPLGLKLRATGLAPAAARAIGLPGARLRLLAFSASGALAGLAGGLEVLAVTGRLYDPFSAGAGYTGIAAALLGGSHPLAAAASAMLFAALGAGSSAMQRDTGVPGALATIVPGVLVLTVLAARARLTQKRA